jgi:serine phosphatase RsbU (regulator of sigma subunit)
MRSNPDKILPALHRLSHAISRADSMESVCREILKTVVAVIPVGKASIMKYDPADETLKVVAAHGMPMQLAKTVRVEKGEGISGKVFASGKPLRVGDVRDLGRKASGRYRSKSLMVAPVCMPLKMNGTPVGVINVTDKRGRGEFTKEDLELLTTIANHTASYLHLTNLAENARRSEQLHNEIELARSIQQGLLPDVLPKIPNLDVAGICVPATHVGGDYFDVIQHSFAPPTIVVADVSGHNVGAALLMSAFRSTIRTGIAGFYMGPAQLMSRLHAHMYADLVRAEQWISCCYVQFFPNEREIRYSAAGHLPPLLYSAREKRFLQTEAGDTILGVLPDVVFAEERARLEPGDWMVLCTDGLYEARKGEKMLGLEHVRRVIRKHAKGSARQMLKALMDDVKKFVAPGPLKDDVTIVVAKIR